MENNGKIWNKFLQGLASETFIVPPELIEHNNFVIFFFLCLLKPLDVGKWAKKIDTSNLLFNNEDYHVHLYNNVRTQFYGPS